MMRQRHQWRACRPGCEENNKLFCVCQEPYDYDYKPGYLGCDGCSDWFHPHCIDVSNRLFRKLDKAPGPWYCDLCAPWSVHHVIRSNQTLCGTEVIGFNILFDHGACRLRVRVQYECEWDWKLKYYMMRMNQTFTRYEWIKHDQVFTLHWSL